MSQPNPSIYEAGQRGVRCPSCGSGFVRYVTRKENTRRFWRTMFMLGLAGGHLFANFDGRTFACDNCGYAW